LDYLTIHTNLSPIRRGFAPGFVNYKKECTRLATASDKDCQLLARGQWFSPGTPASSTTKTGRHDIAETGVKHYKSNQINQHLVVFRTVNTIQVVAYSKYMLYCAFDIIQLMIVDEVDIRIYKHKKLIFTEAMSSNDIYRYCYFVS